MAGYNGYSKSNNAIDAEDCGRFPMTQAKTIVAKRAELTIKEARGILKKIGTAEYHHTSKFYNTTNYYDTSIAVNIIKLSRLLELPINDSFIGAFFAYGLNETIRITHWQIPKINIVEHLMNLSVP